ncbi:ATP-dependent helicase [Myceligenerans pegani]|uniref:DNA 3'-5' helicase n=1 Tax=Myceligenerans pegani TaxID=2776917 RepID=A0ABR9MTJ5_9MICO|nr:ATP-dependent DNA helicase UvrD2 [Myceligenerans sp. TRM 65318]MBE1874694.1 ATP-dependent DNA helicase UvrD2 [Myceligenerans sp. TRM 65318]MBE3016965.1 ATP-dependent DNA helicase UvrD2 [Myceligenerans sp. TRM 65318]
MVTHAPALSNSATGPVHPDSILDALDPEQREVALALRGPVCVLAGAGTGKTRALTHRIAYGVRTGVYKPNSVLAVTFTARAAGEMRTRLRGLGVQGVQARTFHAAALRQLAYFWPRVVGGAPPRLVEHKAQFVAESARRLGLSVDRVAVRDLSSEVEWAKVSLVTADDYERVAAARDREAPSGYDHQTIARLITMYEDVKTERDAIDFEDVLLMLSDMLNSHKAIADEVRGQYRHFVVDEYQDVSPLQQFLLDQWLGGREELCVVGDPSQTIYSFTGATPRYLLDFRRRFRNATEIRLVRDYRSTPQVVGLANDLLRRAGRGAAQALELVAQRDPGPPVTFTTHDDDETEATAIATRASRLIESGVPASEIAVLYRTNAQSEAFESAFADAGVGYLVRGGERFFQRKEVRDAIVLLRGAARSADPEQTMPEQVRDVLAAAGWAAEPPAARGAARERWDSMQALVALADDLAASATEEAPATIATLVDELTERAKAQHAPTVEGVTLASLHAAKGLEWDAVFLAGMSEGLMPISLAETDEAVHEERRLLYVGITRARERLEVSFARSRNPGGRATRKRTRFLDGIWPDGEPRGPRRPRGGQGKARALLTGEHDVALFDALREWRLEVAQEADKPAYTILTDASLAEIAESRPGSVAELARVNGIGPGKIDRYGPTILSIVSSAPSV